MTRIPLNHPLLDDEDRAMQKLADRCMRAGVGHSFKWNTGRHERIAEVVAITESEICYRYIDGGVKTLPAWIPREPARAALAYKSLRARAGGSPN